ncbi:LytR C-terminal domain-containing protein [Streptomyces sp. NPDC005955]|uniref:LCP family protein n=1 Tax=Streptomyces sp. NPDC005955 TaxID=3364738 RepID=UPI00369F9F37
MNGRDDRYGGPEHSEGGDGFASYELAGYDEYGRPVYQQRSQDPAPSRQGYGDGYGVPPEAPYGTPQPYGASDGSTGYGTEQAPHFEGVAGDGYGTPQDYGTPQGYGTAAAYDPAQGYATPQGQVDPGAQGYGYDPYAVQQPPYDGYGTSAQGYDQSGVDQAGYGTVTSYAPHDPYASPDPYGQPQADPGTALTAEQTAYVPPQAAAPDQGYAAEAVAPVPAQTARDTGDGRDDGDERDGQGGSAGTEGQRDYRTEQFAFVEEPDGDPEDVIDWLTFTENRTERREEAKRRARGRVVALGVVLALVVVGTLGYLGFAGKLPGLSGDDDPSATGPAGGPQKRDVVLVHLHHTKKGGTSTALLVDNTTTKQGSTILLPNTLSVSADDGTSTTLAKSVDDDGSTGTRESVDTLLGTSIEGTWRIDTPYLSNLVELVGNIDIDTDADVPAEKAKKGQTPFVRKGEQQTLSGAMAVAYATHRAPGEAQDAQLARFGQVMQGVLRKISSDTKAATVTVESLAQILDPSLTAPDLGAFLAKLSDRAKGGDYKTALLPVESGGALAAEATTAVVKPLLGGTVKAPAEGDAVRVGVRNASGTGDAGESARVALVNGGYTVVDGGKGGSTAPTTRVVYGDAAREQEAGEVAKTLGLPASAVKKGTVEGNAVIEVVLGQDYEPQAPQG